jgi:hypothetical protein
MCRPPGTLAYSARNPALTCRAFTYRAFGTNRTTSSVGDVPS